MRRKFQVVAEPRWDTTEPGQLSPQAMDNLQPGNVTLAPTFLVKKRHKSLEGGQDGQL